MPVDRRRWASTSLAAAATLILFVMVGALVWTVSHRPDRAIPKVAIGANDAVYYSRTANQDDALALGRALRTLGYFGDRGTAVMLSRRPGAPIVSFVVPDGAWRNPATVASFEEIGRRVAGVVGGFPIELRLADAHWTVQKTLQVGRVGLGSHDEIYYFGSASESEARALGKALEEAGYLQDRGVTVTVSKGDGTGIAFVVDEGAWRQPETPARFESLARRVAGSIGGLPIQLQLLSPQMEVIRQVEVR